MVTIAALNNMFAEIYQHLQRDGIYPKKMILFGSYAKGHPKQYSDGDITIIADEFSGSRILDMKKYYISTESIYLQNFIHLQRMIP